jgi:hypothetical protein
MVSFGLFWCLLVWCLISFGFVRLIVPFDRLVWFGSFFGLMRFSLAWLAAIGLLWCNGFLLFGWFVEFELVSLFSCHCTFVQDNGSGCMEQRGDFQNPSCALGGYCPHTACPLLIAGRCDGPAPSVTPRPRGRAYQVWSIAVQLSSVALTTWLLWTACMWLCSQFELLNVLFSSL